MEWINVTTRFALFSDPMSWICGSLRRTWYSDPHSGLDASEAQRVSTPSVQPWVWRAENRAFRAAPVDTPFHYTWWTWKQAQGSLSEWRKGRISENKGSSTDSVLLVVAYTWCLSQARWTHILKLGTALIIVDACTLPLGHSICIFRLFMLMDFQLSVGPTWVSSSFNLPGQRNKPTRARCKPTFRPFSTRYYLMEQGCDRKFHTYSCGLFHRSDNSFVPLSPSLISPTIQKQSPSMQVSL